MSRTANFLRNIQIALISQFIGVLLGFISRKVFIVFLSAEYLGLSGLFHGILSMLSLAELGIGSAIIFSLYKPIAQNDVEQIKSLMLLYKKAYTAIGCFVLVVGSAFTPFLELFLGEMPDIPLVHVYYVMYVARTGVSYLFTYRRSLIIAHQKRYIVDMYYRVIHIGLIIAQIAALAITGSFTLYLALQIIATLLENILLSHKANKLYPYLKDKQIAALPKETARTIKKNVFALICHKIGGIVVFSTDSILIARLVGIVEVGLYSNYLLIKSGVDAVIGLLFQSVTASMGNLNVEVDSAYKKEIYERLNFAGAWIYGFCSTCLWVLFNPFIELWLGREFLFEPSVVFWIVLNFYVIGMRKAVSTTRSAMGLFWYDRYKPLFESVINFIASIILALKLGITGIFIGTFISTITTSFWVEPLMLYKHGLHAHVQEYFLRYGIYTAVSLIAIALTSYLCGLIPIAGVIGLIIKMAICVVTPNVIFIIAYFRTGDFRYFIRLFAKIIRKQMN